MMIIIPICQAKKCIKSQREGIDLFCNSRENYVDDMLMTSPDYIGDATVF